MINMSVLIDGEVCFGSPLHIYNIWGFVSCLTAANLILANHLQQDKS